MKKSILLTGTSMLVSSFAFAQIGINTPSPSSTLDITAKNASGTSVNVDGLLIPRVDRQRAQSMTGVPASTMIYVNSIATGTAAGTAVNIDAVGYYFYNGTVWAKLQTPSVNIYNADGTLTGNRVVTQGANTLAFTGSTVNAFSVDEGTLSVDAANHRIGIGTGAFAPFAKLHLNGNLFMNAARTGSITKDALDINIGEDGFGYGNRTDNYGINMKSLSSVGGGSIARINFGDNNPTTATGFKYLSFSVGNPTLTELMYLTSANNGTVGIATTTPQKTFHVNGSFQVVGEFNVGGSATAAGSAGTTGQILTSNGAGAAPSWQAPAAASSVNIYNTNGTLTGNRVVTQGANTLAFTGTSINTFNVAANTLSVDAANSRVGLGTTTPAEKLDVSGAVAYSGSVASIKTAAGSIDYNSGGSRIISWGPNATTPGYTAFWSGVGGGAATEFMRLASNGNFGVGTATPQKTVHVNGSLQVTNELNVGGNGATAGSAGTTGQILTSNGAGAAPSWQAVPTSPSVNIYNSDGTLAGNRTVTQGANTLAFTGTSVNAFSVAGNSFSVDAAGGRVGFGTTAPGGRLHMYNPIGGNEIGNDYLFDDESDISLTQGLLIRRSNSGANLAFNAFIGGVNFVPKFNGTFGYGGSGMVGIYRGNGTNNLTALAFRINSNAEAMCLDELGNVGVGTSTPQKKLHVNGSLQVTNELNVGGTDTTAGSAGTTGQILTSNGTGAAPTWQTPAAASSVNIYNTNGTLTGNRVVTQAANTLAFTGTSINAFNVAANTLSVDAANSRVGLGTTTPAEKLDVSGAVAYSGSVASIKTAAGSIDYNSGGSRIISWGPNATTSGYTAFWSGVGGGAATEKMRLASNGNLGIGTAAPTAQLHTTGTVRVQGYPSYNLLGTDAGGNLVSGDAGLDNLGIPRPAVFQLTTGIGNFLNGAVPGGSQVVPMTMIANYTGSNGVTYDGISTITFQPGLYQIIFTYEADHNITGCTLSSHFVDFPITGSTQRVHSTAAHSEGGPSNYGGNVTYTTKITTPTSWPIQLGRGQSGNCVGPGMSLKAGSTQLSILRIGN
ncbi:hypothetical protein M2347_003156 [Chryseobacterium sp. H1D6B]|uniref:beta strand repeat-containing protein n=1 Tax=Chryseobacterium sp. H1D6B TaxID=2940588 RepID=UPI0015C78E7E|nr:hypothetical protein [Chryseobacterium sp. H1D6B]MDH6253429.1 hypothetical protein [Chryseobacterium sp. H1D6B]